MITGLFYARFFVEEFAGPTPLAQRQFSDSWLKSWWVTRALFSVFVT
jgi:hypothetical protein